MNTKITTLTTLILLTSIAMPISGIQNNNSNHGIQIKENSSTVTQQQEEGDKYDDPPIEEDGKDDYPNKAPGNYYLLWSKDVDKPNKYKWEDFHPNRYFGDAPDRLKKKFISRVTDITYRSPPPTKKWNLHNLNKFPVSNVDVSYYPAKDTELRNSDYIKEAYITFFTANPMTVFYKKPGEKQRYISPDGGVILTRDYRIKIPEDEEEGPKRVHWELKDHKVETTLWIGDDSKKRDVNHKKIAFPMKYKDLKIGETLKARADITAKIKKKTRECSDWDEENNECDGEWEEDTTIEEDELVVDDVLDAKTYNLTYNVTRLETPPEEKYNKESFNQSQYWYINSTVPFAGLNFSNKKVEEGDEYPGWSFNKIKYRNGFRFFTARNERWDYFKKSTEKKTKDIDPGVRPVHVYGYPTSDGPDVAPDPEGRFDYLGEEKIEPSKLEQENVDIEIAEEPYYLSDEIAISNEDREYSIDDMEMIPLVRGAEPTLKNYTVVKRKNVSVATMGLYEPPSRKGVYRFLIILIDPHKTGGAINLWGRWENVIAKVNGDIEEVLIPGVYGTDRYRYIVKEEEKGERLKFEFEFNSLPWWEQYKKDADEIILGDAEVEVIKNRKDHGVKIVDAIISLLVILFFAIPLGYTLYFFRKIIKPNRGWN